MIRLSSGRFDDRSYPGGTGAAMPAGARRWAGVPENGRFRRSKCLRRGAAQVNRAASRQGAGTLSAILPNTSGE